MRLFIAALALFFLTIASGPAAAHRVNVFAYVDGDVIHVECSFSRSQKVRQGRVEVYDAVDGEMLVSGDTDDTGVFRFPVPPKARQGGRDLRIRLVAGEGHQNEWTVAADEFAAVPSAAPVTSAPAVTPAAVSSASAAPAAMVSAVPATGLTAAEVERIVNAALDARLAPIKRMLAEQSESGPGLRDIVGGLGWILGLAGLAAYFRRRR